MAASTDATGKRLWWSRAGWFVLLWIAGVLATALVAGVFKLLIMAATQL